MIRGRAWDVTIFQLRSTCYAKLSYIFLVIFHGYELLHFSPFEYPREDLSVGCTSYPEVRYVSLINPDLIISFTKNKNKNKYVLYFCTTKITKKNGKEKLFIINNKFFLEILKNT